MIKLIVIGGPTASGKTDLAVKIAKEFNGELINADSRQVYRYLDIGTNKGKVEVGSKKSEVNDQTYYLNGILIHLISFLNPDEQFSVFDYKKLAEEKIEEITSRDKLPILVGGTGLYIDAVMKNYDLHSGLNPGSNIKVDSGKRKELEGKSVEELQKILQTTNFELLTKLNNSDINNPRRLIRLIERNSTKKSEISSRTKSENKYETLFLYPSYDWEELKRKIENRVEQMFNLKAATSIVAPHNIVEETKKVLEMGFSKDSIALQGIGYREVLEYIDNKIDLPKCIELVKISHRQYAKRQKTWFESGGRGYELIKVTNFTEALDKVRSLLIKN
jgi:tRNA dimethylallyltransferase